MIQEEAYEYTLADVCPDGGNLANCVSDLNTLAGDGAGNLYYHDADLANGAGDNSYRYSGANPNNYVCFGTDAESCPTDNLYRIIGVFDNQVKLIKATSYGNYAWEQYWHLQGNTWDETTKPDIYTTLNETYYNTLGSEWQYLIVETIWQVGGFSGSSDITKQVYDKEVGINQTGHEETMKIGLMYASDYGFAAPTTNWGITLNTMHYGTDNWLLLDDEPDWLISRSASGSYYAFIVDSSLFGSVASDAIFDQNAVRPFFYLAPTVEISSGTGTRFNPFILNLG